MSTKNKSEEEVVNELGDEFLNYDGVEGGNVGTEENTTTTENVEKKIFESVAEPTDKSKDSEEGPLGKSEKVNTDLQEQADPGFSLEDCTWENEDDVYAEELLEEYWAKLQAESSKSHSKRKGGRKRAAQSPPPTPVKRETKKQPSTASSSAESWEDKVIAVETVTRDDKTGDLLVYLKWNNGETSRHPAKDVNIKCPQKMIKFYEQRLTFAPPSTHNKS
ncbi:2553_t:CDS:2 [Diversispora eburnea]|uniref:2553_t:CDS:1 n=1 Tax=Diversispora eburnea TaxID=1213867 RepID=A0A9N8V1B4_9GLOM|nr:2553_t:CDS:2 [Diversispora eburnea]